MAATLRAESSKADAPFAFPPVARIHSCHQKCPRDTEVVLQDRLAVPREENTGLLGRTPPVPSPFINKNKKHITDFCLN